MPTVLRRIMPDFRSSLLSDAWRLAVPYFNSEERWSARLLLAAVLALNLLGVAFAVLLNSWNGAFTDALQAKDGTAFSELLLTYRVTNAGFMPGFVAIVAAYIPLLVIRVYLRKILEIRWRRWMTEWFTRDWLTGRAYYTISLTTGSDDAGTDNPDQRIAEDVRDYVAQALQLGISLLSQIVTFVSFAGILWSLSGNITVLGVTIPGYMLWLALIYAGVGTWLTHLVGNPLVALQFLHQRVEADFRYGLVRLRDNTEGVALSGGEAEEERSTAGRFGAVQRNWMALAKRELKLDAFVRGFDQVAAVFPLVIAAPRYFAGAITLGDLFRTAGAFASVNNALTWFVESYKQIAIWRATVVRLTGFQQAIAEAHALNGTGPVTVDKPGHDIALQDVTLALPDGTLLLDHANLAFQQGRSTVITGRSGSGKSTLFRALAGIWPYGDGTIERPPGRILFLPQRPYFPIGTLRRAITYPAPADQFPDEAVIAALTAAGLQSMAGQLDDDEPWNQRLSGGEQQRLAIARALLLRPDWLFMDEATANLDPEAEAEVYATLRRELPKTTVVSIAHRPAVADYHDEARVFRRPGSQPGTLEAARPAVPMSSAE